MKKNIQGQLMMLSRRMLHGFLIQMLFCTLLLANTGNAQRKTIDKVRVSFPEETQSLMTFFKTVEGATAFRFTYNSDFVDLDQPISVTRRRLTLYDALGDISRQTKLRFVQVNENIHVKNVMDLGEEAAVSIVEQDLLDVSGKVVDANGEPLPGVTVTVLGTNVGTVTDLDGNYSLAVQEGATLVFSFIGFESQNIEVTNQSVVDVTLREDVASLDEVIVVGYGTQKKANMTGSVATVGGEEIVKRPLTNVAGLLQGKVAGLQVSSHSGKPGSENNSLRIRGLGTFSAAGSEPLVLINGVAGDMTNLDPNDVESVSVLKDAASSAIYGARAANGVILITTKRGKEGELSIDIHSNVQVHQPTRLPELLSNSADYMMYWNQGRARSGQTPYFSQEEIDAFRNNPNDPINYPNFDWIDHSFQTSVANMQSVRVSGGTEKTAVGLSLGYFDQPGLTSLYEFKKYNARLTIDSKINDWISVGGDIQLVNKDIQRSNWDNGNVDYQILAIYGAAPNYTPTMLLPDGSRGYVARYSSNIGEWTVRNPDAQNVSGVQTDINYNILPQFYAEIKPSRYLTWYTKGAVSYDTRQYKNHETPVDNYFFKDGSYAHNNSTWQLGVREAWSTRMWTTFYSTLNYKRLFNETHNVNILAGYNQEYNLDRSLRGSRVHFPTNELKELDAGAPLDQTTGGNSSEWAIMSFFGRAMYDYKEKYLLEANARFDGTSRISPNNRWGFFPSVSAGWRVSQEPFLMQSDWLENFKIRASWGQLGNQNIGLYPYQEVLTTTSYPFSTPYAGVVLNRLVDPSLRWETTTMTDIGFDLTLKEGLINVTFDWFDKTTDDILYNIPIPASVGLSPPTVNYGKMRNTGVEIELGSMRQIGDFRYDLSVNFSTFKNEVLRILSPVYGNYTIQEGLPFNSHYMVEWIGIFQNEEEIANSPQHQFNPKPGDLKFKDQNNDGVINADDRVVMDGAYPRFHYGSTINLSWKNFDLNAFFQGLEGYKQSTQGLTWGLVPYIQGSPPPVDFIENMWTGEGSTNAHPAMYISGYAPVTGTRNSYWLLDASYLRLKNLALGYNLPTHVSERLGLKFARVYLSGDNLFTITDWPGSDPERANTNWFQAYPQITSYTLGLKLKL